MLRPVLNILFLFVASIGLGMLGVAVLRHARNRLERVVVSAGICAVIAFGMAGMLAEIAARFFRDVPVVLRVTHFREYKPGWFALIPNAEFYLPPTDPSRDSYKVSTNEDGLRTNVHGDAPVRERRVMFFGDSFTFGIGLREPDTMPKQAEKLLNEANTGAPWVAINAGVPGYNVLSSIELFDSVVDHYKPEVVVFTIGDVDDIAPDVSDRWRAGEQRGEPASLERFALYRYFTLGRDWARYSSNFEITGETWVVRDEVLHSQLPRLSASISKMEAAAKRSGVRLIVNLLVEPPTGGPVGSPARSRGHLTAMGTFATIVKTTWDRSKTEEILVNDGHPNELGARRLAAAVVPIIGGARPVGSATSRD